MTDRNWMKIHSGLNEPKHREAIGIRIWLFMDIIDQVDWETGMVWGWRDEEAAERLGMPVKTLRTQRRELKEAGYIQLYPGDQCQHIMVLRWRNPRMVNAPQINVPEEDCDDWVCPKPATPGIPKPATPRNPKVGTPPSRKVGTPILKSQESETGSDKDSGAAAPTPPAPVEEKPAESKEPKPLTEWQQQLKAMAEPMCKITGDDMNIERIKRRAGTIAAVLIKAEYTPDDLPIFLSLWKRYDWRGLKGQPPTLEQVQAELPRLIKQYGRKPGTNGSHSDKGAQPHPDMADWFEKHREELQGANHK